MSASPQRIRYTNGMMTQAPVAPEEYLKMAFEGVDREFVDGELVERSMPTLLHGRTQVRLGYLFEKARERYPVWAASEVRHVLDPQRLYRIPDVAVYAGTLPAKDYPDTPPLVAIEIASPDDRLSETLKKFAEYRKWGVEHVWLIDPDERAFFLYDATGLHPVDALHLPQYELTIRLADLGL